MAQCEITGKGPVTANLVSHSNIKTKTVSNPNVHYKRLKSQALNQFFNLKVATSTIKSIEHSGGFDSFILRANDEKLSKRALTIKRRVRRKLKGNNKKSN